MSKDTTKVKVKNTDGILSVSGVKPEAFLPEGTDASVFGIVDKARDEAATTTLLAIQKHVEETKLANFTAKPISLGGSTTFNASSSNYQITASVTTTHSDALTAVFDRADTFAASMLTAIGADDIGEEEPAKLAA